MSYIYPTGISTGFSGVAAYMMERMASGVTGTPTPLPAPTGSDGFLLAMCDALMGAFGPGNQGEAAGAGAATTTNTAFEDVGNGTSTGFTVYNTTFPVSKTYLILINVAGVFATVSTGRVTFQLLIDGAAPSGQPSGFGAAGNHFSALNTRNGWCWAVSAYVAAGTRALKLQWKVDSGTTGNVDATSGRCFTVLG